MLTNNLQNNRLLQVSIPGYQQPLMLTNINGQEYISKPFQFNLTILTPTTNNYNEEKLMGSPISFQINGNTEPRYFNGIISNLHINIASMHNMKEYQIKVVPWIWLLSKTTDCRIFQNKSVTEIINAIFQQYGFKDYDLSKVNSIAKQNKLEYCVQYNETSFNFISRLMEETGIFYYFAHTKNKHLLILNDNSLTCAKYHNKKIIYSNNSRAQNKIHQWQQQYNFHSNQITQLAYNFQTPKTTLLSQAKSQTPITQFNFELFNYIPHYHDDIYNKTLTQLQLAAQAATYYKITGNSNYWFFSPGNIFTLNEHPNTNAQTNYLLLYVSHNAYDYTHLTQQFPDGKSQSYSNTFNAIPATTKYCPPENTIKPCIHGVQTAFITGNENEEICIDKFGRVKVQFSWDRNNKHNQQNSCWIRVAQPWSGKNHGIIFHPRVGDEVIVTFLAGNPDWPIIIGNVYNGYNNPPYDLPLNKTQSGIKTNSCKNGTYTTANEIKFEDKKNQEEIFIHAQKDLNRVIEHNTNTTIKRGNQRIQIQQGSSSLEAKQKIEFKVGNNVIIIDTTGIKINGTKVGINN
jgi:type VI secretion system secreted protein VgrG